MTAPVAKANKAITKLKVKLRIPMGLTIAQLSERLRCTECRSQLHLVKP
jgi:hypothetical protein